MFMQDNEQRKAICLLNLLECLQASDLCSRVGVFHASKDVDYYVVVS